jgi:hypothetical protein
MLTFVQDDADEFKFQVDWRPPGKAEERIKQLFVPLMNTTGKSPDLISLHSGSKSRLLAFECS